MPLFFVCYCYCCCHFGDALKYNVQFCFFFLSFTLLIFIINSVSLTLPSHTHSCRLVCFFHLVFSRRSSTTHSLSQYDKLCRLNELIAVTCSSKYFQIIFINLYLCGSQCDVLCHVCISTATFGFSCHSLIFFLLLFPRSQKQTMIPNLYG